MSEITVDQINESLTGSRYEFRMLSADSINESLASSRYNFRLLTTPIEQVASAAVAEQQPEILVTQQSTPVQTVAVEVALANVVDIAPIREAKRGAVVLESAKKAGKWLGYAALSMTAMAVGMRTIDAAAGIGDNSRSAAPAPAEATTTSAVTELSAPAETIITTTTSSTVAETAPATSEPAATTTEAVVPSSTEAPMTTLEEAAPTTTEVAPVLSLTQRIMSGETTIGLSRGQKLGKLRLEKYCDDVQMYVANPIDTTTNEGLLAAMPVLSPEAKMQAQYLLDHPNLPSGERLEIEDNIRSKGFSNYSGDPMYYAGPAAPADPNCIPMSSNPRANQNAYGSTEVEQVGGKANQYQAVAGISEFGDIPGQHGVTYVQMHRSSQNAAGNSFNPELANGFKVGDVAVYSYDDQNVLYAATEVVQIGENQSIPEFIASLKARNDGQEYMVVQVCVDGDDSIRNIYIFVRV